MTWLLLMFAVHLALIARQSRDWLDGLVPGALAVVLAGLAVREVIR